MGYTICKQFVMYNKPLIGWGHAVAEPMIMCRLENRGLSKAAGKQAGIEMGSSQMRL
jgi:hypothetical protein